MKIQDLPVGSNPEPLAYPHFPTRHQAVIWRNWGLVLPATLAAVLKTSEANILQAADALGLRVPPEVSPLWVKRGYNTVIRANWHLLPYGQLIQLLDWSPEKMEAILLEDDFLFIKLGQLKPRAKEVFYRELSEDETARTKEIRSLLDRHFPARNTPPRERPFDFQKRFTRPPSKNLKPKTHKSLFELRFVYPHTALVADTFLDITENDPCPEGLLSELADLGVNGIWLYAVLHQFYPWEPAKELSIGYEKRLANLRTIVRRAEKFGIGLYLYLNEPRGLPLRFYQNCPELLGVTYRNENVGSLCTSQPEVIDFLEKSTSSLFTEVKGLAGVFTITMSENPTHCWTRGRGTECPRCANRPPYEVVAEVNRAIEKGVHRVKPDARVMAWTWAWSPDWLTGATDWKEEWTGKAIELLPEGIQVMCTSEEALETHVGGVAGRVVDYSLSQVGPGPKAKKVWSQAQRQGLGTVAKVQANNTWECASVPYIPVMDLVEEHFGNLAAQKLNGIMLSWTLGGYPSINLELLSKSREELALENYGAEAAPFVLKAWSLFSKAFREYPFSGVVVYRAPVSVGPMNLLFERETGYESTMTGFPYDDLKTWRHIYSEEVFEDQFGKLTLGWKEGLDALREAELVIDVRKRGDYEEMKRVSTVVYCCLRSTYLQVKFIRWRNRLDRHLWKEMIGVLEEEVELARSLHDIVRDDSRFGFEASNHYCFTVNDLQEKVLNCEWLKNRYEQVDGSDL